MGAGGRRSQARIAFSDRQAPEEQSWPVIAALALAAALSGQADDAPAEAAPKAAAKPATTECVPPVPVAGSQEVVVCATKPDGYRISPDVLAAKKAKRQALAGRAKPPENFKDHSCQVVGTAPCLDAPMVNLLGATAIAAEMAERLSKGQEIGSMFVTDPQLTEYQYYQLARKERQEKEAEKAATKAKAAAVRAKAETTPATTGESAGDKP